MRINANSQRLPPALQRRRRYVGWRLVDVTRRRRCVATGPAQTDHEIVRAEILVLEAVVGAGDDAVDRVGDRAVVEIAVGEIDLEILADVISDAGIQRVGEMPFAWVTAEAVAAVRIDVGEIGQSVVGAAEADADKWRPTIPGAEIDESIRQENPGFQIALLFIETVWRIGHERVDALPGTIL